jgi:hypothetical protein
MVEGVEQRSRASRIPSWAVLASSEPPLTSILARSPKVGVDDPEDPKNEECDTVENIAVDQ